MYQDSDISGGLEPRLMQDILFNTHSVLIQIYICDKHMIKMIATSKEDRILSNL